MALGEAPANDFAGVVIHDDGDIRPPLADPDIAHVPDPDLVGGRGRRVIEEQVRGLGEQPVAMAVVFEAPRHLRFEAILPHESGHPVPPADDPLGLQGGMNPWIAVGLAAVLEDLVQDLQQLLIIEPSLTRAPVAPGIATAARYPELAAQRRHRAAAFVLGDEPEASYFFSGRSARLSSI